MALRIKNNKADRLARELARRTGESLTEAVTRALDVRLWRMVAREHCEKAGLTFVDGKMKSPR